MFHEKRTCQLAINVDVNHPLAFVFTAVGPHLRDCSISRSQTGPQVVGTAQRRMAAWSQTPRQITVLKSGWQVHQTSTDVIILVTQEISSDLVAYVFFPMITYSKPIC